MIELNPFQTQLHPRNFRFFSPFQVTALMWSVGLCEFLPLWVCAFVSSCHFFSLVLKRPVQRTKAYDHSSSSWQLRQQAVSTLRPLLRIWKMYVICRKIHASIVACNNRISHYRTFLGGWVYTRYSMSTRKSMYPERLLVFSCFFSISRIF